MIKLYADILVVTTMQDGSDGKILQIKCSCLNERRERF